jgi:linoleoyl-CoA desaturase
MQDTAPSVNAHLKFRHQSGNKFFNTLRKRVDAYFIENKIDKHANATMKWKSIILISGYVIPFLLLSSQPATYVVISLWLVMGIAKAGIGMSVMHDANHGAYSQNKKVNQIFGHTLNMLGGSVFNWKLQHNILHHTYTNVTHVDEDITDRLVLKFSPHTKVKSFHKFQWIYVFFFYGLITLYWVVLKDFVQLFKFAKMGVNNNSKAENTKLLIKITIIKAVYLTVMLGIPVWAWHIPFSTVITGFLLMHFTAGIILSTIFQLAHTVEHTTHPMPDENGVIDNEWAIHQMETTVNFARKNKLLSWYVGGLNYQVEHHLFPKISHVHYPAIAPIVKQTAEEFGVPYNENDTFAIALASHVRLLKRFGTIVPNFETAIG